MGLDL
ncbi:hypothetical protein D030_3496A, partial [Vibrio parahaemolyticus AQ3810]